MTRTMTEDAYVATERGAPMNAITEQTTSKKRTRRRCVTLVAALVSAAVWSGLGASPAVAATTVNTWDDLVDAVNDGGIADVALGADITGTSLVLPGGKNLTLDLNGHTLTVNGGYEEAAVQTTGATLTINATGGGSLTAIGGDYGAGIGGGFAGAGGTVTVNGGTVTATGGHHGAGIGGGGSLGGGNGGSVSVIVAAGASVTATAGSGANTVVGSNGGAPDGPVTNSGSLTLNGNQTIYGTFTNTATGVLTVNTRVGGSGTLVNEGTIVVASGAYIAGFETHVTVHNYWVSYSLNGQAGTAPPDQIVYAASFAAAQVAMPAPPTGTRWMSASSGGVPVTATTDLPTVFGVNNDGTVESAKRTLYAQLDRVSYPFAGFFAPIDNGAVNLLKAGQGVPLKFSLGGDQGLGILAGSPTSQPVQCDGSLPSDPVEETVTAGASSLSYDAATGTYTYTWKTDKAWANTCRQLTVTLSDGTSHSALFKLSR